MRVQSRHGVASRLTWAAAPTALDRQDGHCGADEMLARPRFVQLLGASPVTEVACGDYHTVCASAAGLHAFGRGSEGQLGLGEPEEEMPIPQLLQLDGWRHCGQS